MGHDIIRYESHQFTKKFPSNKVGFWESFEITWLITDKKNLPFDQWRVADKSTNPLYVTHYVPLTGKVSGAADTTINFNTLLYLGCKNAEGKTLEGTIVNYMFKEFLDQDVRKVGGTKAMQYWGPGIMSLFPACRPISGLLALENTTCGTWANFFNDMIRIQGIAGSAISEVVYTPPTGSTITQDISDFRLGAPEILSLGMFSNNTGTVPFGSRTEFYVKKWNTTTTDKFVWAELDDMANHLQTPFPTETFSNGKMIRWAEKQGAGAQGNADPRSTFGNHALVKWKSKYFDPSYGNLTAQFPKAWEHKSLWYFGMNLKIIYTDQSGMQIERTVNWIDKLEKQSVLETTITP